MTQAKAVTLSLNALNPDVLYYFCWKEMLTFEMLAWNIQNTHNPLQISGTCYQIFKSCMIMPTSMLFRLNFLYYQLQELNIWPSREVVDQHMPADFKKQFPATRVIIDGTEIPIQKPSNISDQSATWSSYKNRNTLKCLVGISPRGCVTFISPAYGGSASDRQIFERSGLIQSSSLLEAGDSVMADRGFIVQDLLATRDVAVNTPSMLRGSTQLPAQTVLKDRRIANKRVHVERVIGFAKSYKILTHELHKSFVPIGGRILFVCFVLSNFRQSIVSRY